MNAAAEGPVSQAPAAPPAGDGEVDVLLRVRGTVQGVGFRPFVRRAAAGLRLRGWVRNDTQGVLIRAAGPPPAIAALVRAIRADAPPAARVESVEPAEADPARPRRRRLLIAPSAANGLAATTALPPDLALCGDCRRDSAIRRTGAIATLSSTAPSAVPGIRSWSACPMTGPTPRCARSGCARAARPNTTIPTTGASTPSRTPAPSAGRPPS